MNQEDGITILYGSIVLLAGFVLGWVAHGYWIAYWEGCLL